MHIIKMRLRLKIVPACDAAARRLGIDILALPAAPAMHGAPVKCRAFAQPLVRRPINEVGVGHALS